MSWKRDTGNRHFEAVLGWFSPILVVLGCLDRLDGICKWLVYKGIVKSGKAKMARLLKTVQNTERIESTRK